MRLNRRGYLTVEIILAATMTFVIAYFLTDITIKLINKTDNYYVDTIITTDEQLLVKNIKTKIQRDIAEYGVITNVSCNNTNCVITYTDATTKNLQIETEGTTQKITYNDYSKTINKNLKNLKLSGNATKNYIVLQISGTNIFSNANHNIDLIINNRGLTLLELGDYFTLVPDASTYIVYSTDTGYTNDQTITPSELQVWRIIDIHKDGSVDAVSEYISSAEIYFTGTMGYANFVGILQSIAAQYAKAGYTINTRMIGYDGQTATIQTYSDATECASDDTCKTTTTYAFDGSINITSSLTQPGFPTSGIGQEYLKGVSGDTLYLKDIQLVGNVYKSDTSTYGSYGLKAKKPGANSGSGYWLASRVFVRYGSLYVTQSYFEGRNVDQYGEPTKSNTFRWNGGRNVWSDQTNSSYSLRPIITLRPGVTISGGAGTKASPYTLN